MRRRGREETARREGRGERGRGADGVLVLGRRRLRSRRRPHRAKARGGRGQLAAVQAAQGTCAVDLADVRCQELSCRAVVQHSACRLCASMPLRTVLQSSVTARIKGHHTSQPGCPGNWRREGLCRRTLCAGRRPARGPRRSAGVAAGCGASGTDQVHRLQALPCVPLSSPVTFSCLPGSPLTTSSIDDSPLGT